MNTPAISQKQVAEKLANIQFNKFEEILEGIKKKAKKGEKGRLHSGTMSFAEFRSTVAKKLLVPAYKEVLDFTMSLPNVR